MKKLLKQEYTVEFKEQVVKHAQAVGIVTAVKSGINLYALRAWTIFTNGRF